jgi:hypothetical protein
MGQQGETVDFSRILGKRAEARGSVEAIRQAELEEADVFRSKILNGEVTTGNNAHDYLVAYYGLRDGFEDILSDYQHLEEQLKENVGQFVLVVAKTEIPVGCHGFGGGSWTLNTDADLGVISEQGIIVPDVKTSLRSGLQISTEQQHVDLGISYYSRSVGKSGPRLGTGNIEINTDSSFASEPASHNLILLNTKRTMRHPEGPFRRESGEEYTALEIICGDKEVSKYFDTFLSGVYYDAAKLLGRGDVAIENSRMVAYRVKQRRARLGEKVAELTEKSASKHEDAEKTRSELVSAQEELENLPQTELLEK